MLITKRKQKGGVGGGTTFEYEEFEELKIFKFENMVKKIRIPFKLKKIRMNLVVKKIRMPFKLKKIRMKLIVKKIRIPFKLKKNKIIKKSKKRKEEKWKEKGNYFPS